MTAVRNSTLFLLFAVEETAVAVVLRFLLVVALCNCWDFVVFVSAAAPLLPPSVDLELVTTLFFAPSLPRRETDAVDFFVSGPNFPDPEWSPVISLVLDLTRLL